MDLSASVFGDLVELETDAGELLVLLKMHVPDVHFSLVKEDGENDSHLPSTAVRNLVGDYVPSGEPVSLEYPDGRTAYALPLNIHNTFLLFVLDTRQRS